MLSEGDTSVTDPEPVQYSTYRAPDITVLKVAVDATKSTRPWHDSTKGMKVECLAVALITEIKRFPEPLREWRYASDDEDDEGNNNPPENIIYTSFHKASSVRHNKYYLRNVESKLSSAKDDTVLQAAYIFVNRDLYKQDCVVARACSGDYWSWTVLSRSDDEPENIPEPGTAEFYEYQPSLSSVRVGQWSKKRRLGTRSSDDETQRMLATINELFPDDAHDTFPRWIQKLLPCN